MEKRHIQLMAKEVLSTMKRAKYFAVSVDSIRDISHVDHVNPHSSLHRLYAVCVMGPTKYFGSRVPQSLITPLLVLTEIFRDCKVNRNLCVPIALFSLLFLLFLATEDT